MQPKLIVILAGATALLGGGALLLEQAREEAVEARDAALLPGLAEGAAGAARIELVTSDGELVLEKSGGSWGLADRGGYPVLADKVSGLLFGLAQAKRLEQKTSNPARYGDLGLDDVKAPGATGALVRIQGSEGALLAEVVVGLRRTNGDPAYYTRVGNEAATFLASGELRVPRTRREWMDTAVSKIARDRLTRVAVRHPDGEQVLLARLAEGDENLSIENLPEGKSPANEWITGRFTSALEFLTLDDVLAREELPAEAAVTTEFHTKDGLVVTVTSILEPAVEGGPPERLKANLTARFEENPIQPWSGPLAPGEGPTVDLLPEEGAEAETASVTPEAARAEAEALAARFGSWTIVLSGYRKNIFQVKMAELLKVEEPALPVEPITEIPPGLEFLNEDPPVEGPPQQDGLTPDETTDAIEESAPPPTEESDGVEGQNADDGR